MLRGFYTVASGMLSQQRKTEMLSNNLSNANTPGYKADRSSMKSFPEMMLSLQGQNQPNGPMSRRVGALNTGVYMQETMPAFLQGDLQETERKTDVALVDGNVPVDPETGQRGGVFFTLQGGDGVPRYTRNGNFTLDGQGYLTSASGLYVLDQEGQRIQLPADNFKITEEGRVLVNEMETARLGIGFSVNSNRLTKEGDGLFITENNEPLPNAYDSDATFNFQQGFIERSNVDTSRTMTDMMTAYRSFEANQKVLQAYDRSMEKAVNEVGRVNG
ncbi:flagellar hook-basal body protein [Rossellomorea vietnamensis]|uniref:Flagellar hook-basal body protein n=1 Tax=Rossellomorea vietnamensis TaxID=218284 RepID=A0A5D4M7Y9_9BACI|nr:flagellar hook-basal body protein [Rossellomorea vietnamensis]TYR97716.1 flagellar hook-basal body protein [Rossellomorea vietnamensis]